MSVSHGENLLSVTASFGVADFNRHMNKLEDLIKLADVALYKAKNSGRNIVCDVSDTAKLNDMQHINAVD